MRVFIGLVKCLLVTVLVLPPALLCYKTMTVLLKLNRASLTNIKGINSCYFSTLRKQAPFVTTFSLLKPTSSIQNQHKKFWETFPSTTLSFYLKDGLDKAKYDLVYKSRLFTYAFYSQLLSGSAIAVQVFYSTYYVYKMFVLYEEVEKITHVGPFNIHYDLVTFAILTFFTFQNILLFYIAQRAVLRVYNKKDTNEYVIVTLSINPFKSLLTLAKAGELKTHHVDSILSIFGNHEIRGKKLFMKYESFKNTWHYNNLLGVIKE